MDPVSSLQQLQFFILIFILGLSFILTLAITGYLLCFISFNEYIRVWSPFNIQLIALGFSMTGLITCSLIQALSPSDTPLPCVLQAFEDLLTATFELLYLQYSWGRASSIIETVYPRTSNTIKTFYRFAPLVVYAQVIPATVDAICSKIPSLAYVVNTGTYFEQGLSAVAGICIFVFDATLLLGFRKYVWENTRSIKAAMAHTDHTFQIISNYGAGSCIMWMIGSIELSVTMAFQQYSFEYNTVIACTYVTGILAWACLVMMKVSIHKESMRLKSHALGKRPDMYLHGTSVTKGHGSSNNSIKEGLANKSSNYIKTLTTQ